MHENFEAKLKYLAATLGLNGGTFITTKIAHKMSKGAQGHPIIEHFTKLYHYHADSLSLS